MARAKRTDRAEARRRTRASAVAAQTAEDDAVVAVDAPDVAPSDRPASAGPQRPSVTNAFREAYKPIHIRDDIRAIPWLTTRTPAVVVPVGLIVVASAWFLLSAGSVVEIAASRYGTLSGIAFSLLVAPPPIGSAFLAGILAPRMSYMAGFITGLASFIAFSIVMSVAPPGTVEPLPAGIRESWVLWALSIGPVSGILIGAFAGFYRRFLRQINPNSGRRQPQSGKSGAQSRGKSAKATGRRSAS